MNKESSKIKIKKFGNGFIIAEKKAKNQKLKNFRKDEEL